MKKIKGYKAFNKGLICKNFQYEVGKEYEHKDEIKLCKNGFHCCENPLDVLRYYNLCDSEFAEVEAFGKLTRQERRAITPAGFAKAFFEANR